MTSFGMSLIFLCSRPAPYDCVIKPRFPEVLSILVYEKGNFDD